MIRRRTTVLRSHLEMDCCSYADDYIRGSEQVFSPQYFSYYSTKSYVVGTQKNRLTDTILWSTLNIGFECQIRILEHENIPLSRALVMYVIS